MNNAMGGRIKERKGKAKRNALGGKLTENEEGQGEAIGSDDEADKEEDRIIAEKEDDVDVNGNLKDFICDDDEDMYASDQDYTGSTSGKKGKGKAKNDAPMPPELKEAKRLMTVDVFERLLRQAKATEPGEGLLDSECPICMDVLTNAVATTYVRNFFSFFFFFFLLGVRFVEY
jgi:hypothetical protein